MIDPENELPEDHKCDLARLWQAIIDNTRGEGGFWIGEILLTTLERETGFSPKNSLQ